MGTIAADAGRVLMIGVGGPALETEERAILAGLGPAGVVLFRRNLESLSEYRQLLENLDRTLAQPFVLAVDQEGGRVNRLERWVGPIPAAARLAAAGPGATFGIGQATGRVLAALGFSLDFAPVVDLCSAEATNGIGDRSFGLDPRRTAELAGAFLDGLQAEGVAGCAKHFPGLGATAVDSHHELPVCERDLADLRAVDLVPFHALAGRASCVMVSHAAYPAVGDDRRTPATLSRAIVSGLLRGQVGFGGVVVTDDMEMGAVAPWDVDGAGAVAAVDAGCDLVLYCSNLARALAARDALVRRAERDPSFAARLAQAARRADSLPRSARGDFERWERRRDDLRAFAAALAADPLA